MNISTFRSMAFLTLSVFICGCESPELKGIMQIAGVPRQPIQQPEVTVPQQVAPHTSDVSVQPEGHGTSVIVHRASARENGTVEMMRSTVVTNRGRSAQTMPRRERSPEHHEQPVSTHDSSTDALVRKSLSIMAELNPIFDMARKKGDANFEERAFHSLLAGQRGMVNYLVDNLDELEDAARMHPELGKAITMARRLRDMTI